MPLLFPFCPLYLYCAPGDKEQTRAGTGGDPLKEALLTRLAQKAIGFLGGPAPRLLAEMLQSFVVALRTDASLAPLLPTDPTPTAFGHFLCPLLSSFPGWTVPLHHPRNRRSSRHCRRHLPLNPPSLLSCPADTYITQVAMHYPHP